MRLIGIKGDRGFTVDEDELSEWSRVQSEATAHSSLKGPPEGYDGPPDTDVVGESDVAESGDVASESGSEEIGDTGEGGDRPRGRKLSSIAALTIGIGLISAGVVVGLLLADANTGSEVVVRSSLDLPTLGVFDSFARPDSGSLGISDSGQEWTEESGDWGIIARDVVVREPSESGSNLAVVNMRARMGTVQVTMTSVGRASGIVFRYRNAFNYWALTAAPESATWSISKVLAGEVTAIGTVGTAPVDDNTTIAVRFDGNRIEFFVDGTKRSSLVDGDLADGIRAGLYARGPESLSARWTDFVAVAEHERTVE